MLFKRLKTLEGIEMVANLKKIFTLIMYSFYIMLSVDKLILTAIFLLNLILAILPFITIQLNGMLINSITAKKNDSFNIFILIVICTILLTIGKSIYNLLLIKYQCDLNCWLEKKIVEKSDRLKYESFEDSQIYDRLKRVTTDAISKPYSLLTTILSFIKSATQMISVFILLSTSKISGIEWLIVISAILIIPNIAIIKKEYEMQKNQTKLYRKKGYFNNLLTNYFYKKELSIYNLGEKFIYRYSKISNYICSQVIKINKSKSALGIFSQLIIFGVISYLQLMCIKNTINNIYSVGQMTIYIQTILKVDSIVSELLSTAYSMYTITLFIEELYSFMHINEENFSGVSIEKVIRQSNNSLEFHNVTFKYPSNARMILNDINFNIVQGDILAIVGSNGCGKSTILNLICRLYDVNSGAIMFNGIPINKLDLRQWRNQIRITCQDFIKYEFTLKENVLISSDYNSNFDIISPLIHLDKIVNKLPKGIRNQLGTLFPEGVQLSQGEWQKIAVARSLLREGKILILDEPSSSLDSITEQEIFAIAKELIKESKVNFTIFITHNSENLKFANKVLYLNNGNGEFYTNVEDYYKTHS